VSQGTPAKRDGLLALYYEGGSAALFEPLTDDPPPADMDVKLCEAVLGAAPDNVDALSYLGNIYTKRGEHQRGLEIDLRLVRLRPLSPRVHYNLACSYALLGRPDDAFRSVDRAIECGFLDADHMEKDEDLVSLRGDERFKAVVARLRAAPKGE
jgi:tetratricopeptide (TPR) repeat protein